MLVPNVICLCGKSSQAYLHRMEQDPKFSDLLCFFIHHYRLCGVFPSPLHISCFPGLCLFRTLATYFSLLLIVLTKFTMNVLTLNVGHFNV
jgi:hypothetical protein